MAKRVPKKITVKMYMADVIKGKKNEVVKILMTNYSLNEVLKDDFCREFGEMLPEEMRTFILDDKNSMALSMFGHRTTNGFFGYKGLNDYMGSRCTVGAGHRG